MSASAGTISTEAFLAACIKHSKQKVVVNFDSLAKELNMSAGGAANKYRAIIKKIEDEGGAAWASGAPGAATAVAGASPVKTPRKRKAAGGSAAGSAKKKAAKGANGGDDGVKDEDDGEQDVKPVVSKKVKVEEKVVEEAVGTEEGAEAKEEQVVGEE